MKYLSVIFIMLTLLVVGCSEDEKAKSSSTKKIDWDKRIATTASKEDKPKGNRLPTASYGGVKVNIEPDQPVVGDCLKASFRGMPTNKVFTWAVNNINVQQGEDSRFCLEDAFRDDLITVTVGDDKAGGTASVTVGNTPPRIIDTRIELITEGAETFLEVTPKVEDPDEDYVSISYQWSINGEVNEEFSENRLPGSAFQKKDEIFIKITPEDAYAQGATYETRNILVPSAPPTIISRPPKNFETMEYNYKVEAIDPDGEELTFNLEEAPIGMTIDARTGEIVWPLDKATPGEYRINITATDPGGNEDNQMFNLTVGKRKPRESQ